MLHRLRPGLAQPLGPGPGHQGDPSPDRIADTTAFLQGDLAAPFRDCAVTELVDCAPEEIGIAADLLGHANLRTTRKHYIQAQGMTAHVRVQGVIAARRQAAAVRRSSGA